MGNRSSDFKQFHLFFSSSVLRVSQLGAPGNGNDLRTDIELGCRSAIEKRKSHPGNSVLEQPVARICS